MSSCRTQPIDGGVIPPIRSRISCPRSTTFIPSPRDSGSRSCKQCPVLLLSLITLVVFPSGPLSYIELKSGAGGSPCNARGCDDVCVLTPAATSPRLSLRTAGDRSPAGGAVRAREPFSSPRLFPFPFPLDFGFPLSFFEDPRGAGASLAGFRAAGDAAPAGELAPPGELRSKSGNEGMGKETGSGLFWNADQANHWCELVAGCLADFARASTSPLLVFVFVFVFVLGCPPPPSPSPLPRFAFFAFFFFFLSLLPPDRLRLSPAFPSCSAAVCRCFTGRDLRCAPFPDVAAGTASCARPGVQSESRRVFGVSRAAIANSESTETGVPREAVVLVPSDESRIDLRPPSTFSCRCFCNSAGLNNCRATCGGAEAAPEGPALPRNGGVTIAALLSGAETETASSKYPSGLNWRTRIVSVDSTLPLQTNA